ncbi:uncharacterized protein LOC129240255 isoform X1 [Anastrepha obliqua]|uniref:uncharacterized protein LOC129240255 isoform X1 n=1 Tax=Anastrepha obliqua TaxID=95512 RepID=UPI0024096E00|nr:uncharacterized protein LOC129240255 isoform X1 [Anastrepha obliqua]
MYSAFEKIPSTIEIKIEPPNKLTVSKKLEAAKSLLHQRKTQCSSIKQQHKKTKRAPLLYGYKFFCICPKYNPQYACKHTGNVIIDRDVLTKEEHLCFLSTPRENLAASRKRSRYYQKKISRPNCTTRIDQLALPDLKRVRGTLEEYKNALRKRQINSLKQQLDKRSNVVSYNIKTALSYIEEERRLKKVATLLRKQECRKLKKYILRKQQRQIRRIICALFEEMRDFLLNDQFLIDQQSTLCAIILEQIRNFTDSEFYTTSNLREYQQVLANNLTVWINKFISNLNIHISPPPVPTEHIEPETFLPVSDYISCSESIDNEECQIEQSNFYFDEMNEEENDYFLYTEDTITNTNH